MTTTDPATSPKALAKRTVLDPDSRGRLVLRRFLRRRMAVMGMFMVLLFFVFAYVGPALYKWQYNDLDFQAFL